MLCSVSPKDKPLAWLYGEIKTPPLSRSARLEIGLLLRQLQRGELLSMPHSRPMPGLGLRCHELRINDVTSAWRVVHRIDNDAIVILEVFSKETGKTPNTVIDTCRK